MAAVARSRPPLPSVSASVKTCRWLSLLFLASKALKRSTMFGVQLSHLACDVRERHLAELVDHGFNREKGAQLGVLISRIDGPVEIRLAFTSSLQQPFAVQPRHDRHVGRVGAVFGSVAVQRLHHLTDRHLLTAPYLFHHLLL